MSHSTYFEIGGHVIESFVEARPDVKPRPRKDIVEHHLSTQYHIPKKLTKKAAKQVSDETGYDVQRASEGIARGKRAQWAFSTAATLAMADGPLPIGDVLAIGVLGLYGSYEVYHGFKDIVQN